MTLDNTSVMAMMSAMDVNQLPVRAWSVSGKEIVKVFFDDLLPNPREDHDALLGEVRNGKWMDSWEESDRNLIALGAFVVLPIFQSENGLFSPFCSKEFMNRCGTIYTTKKRMEQYGAGNKNSAEIISLLIEEINEMNHWLNGHVYRYVWENSEGVRESSSGFYGPDDNESGLLKAAFGERYSEAKQIHISVQGQ